MNSPPVLRLLFGVLLAALAVSPAFADLPPDVLVKNQWMEVTRGDFDAALARIPEKNRFAFAMSPKRVAAVLNNLLLEKTLAAQARAHGLKTATFAAQAGKDDFRALAKAEMQRIEAEAGADFDARRASFEARAHELYLVNKPKYRTADEVRVSDITVAIAGRGDDSARTRAREVYDRVAKGADFAALAKEMSDDARTRDSGGALPFLAASAVPPAFAKAAFALKKIGDVSEPVRVGEHYHVIRLDERRAGRQQTYDEVREAMLQELRQQHIREKRDLRVRAINEDPSLQMNQPAIDALVNRIDPESMRAKRGQKPPKAGE